MSATIEILEPRRRPTQERSQKKFDLILQTSRDLLLEVGFESFTLEEVANRAGIPIGTIYQFFQNKYVVVCELDRQDVVAVRAELARLAAELPTLDWLRLLDQLVDHIAALWVTDPSRRAVWHAVQSTPATRATAALTERELAADVAHVLAPLTPKTPRARRKIVAEVLVHVAYSMLNFSIRDGQEHAEAVIELKRLLGSYLLAAEQSG
ncbi:TetR family transcriptional regulator [Mumia sp. zg.B53]|uniref:TetR/AcrR family transcriptional regulator n=1 Tax=unclassified Mumia TaxID=2621872 RepID=UPI001C6ED79D|nr:MULTISPECIES: TetR/AcrR family transcriptional regulator [unclassified Mumia]MBW9204575.1 TetR family transcriptional regulator [Mumia sp. zg.B17]MBW9214025.1 TetR family transcriptional regulator [Mumia sp. zg.B53]